ncbi:hypothetical protein Xvie_03716 [Xenorhabdus vietnamensis]|uniref:Uncharacterized protein n=1 Tax=Xenorhabdus vietnamensis TaxID=351656 RepID=A0A1Y2S979_9GAMM|nr:hypothetical protein [Xenorhabdus vietnamensis]OTA14434.1 hypothetical protein Xvie_03716 [Xenorhabdus vietnamensis]
MNKYYEEEPLSYQNTHQEPVEGEFIKDNWSVRVENGKYIFSYISGEFFGQLKEVEINKCDYLQAIENGITFDELCRKYNVF